MKEYIERAALKRELAPYEENDFSQQINVILAIVDAQPAADVVEVRHGKWLDKGWDGDFSWQIDGRGSCWRVYECSECQCKTSAKTDYCPNCGALMDGKEDEDGQDPIKRSASDH